MQNNFSYPLKLEDMSSTAKHYEFQADEHELKYIAEVLKLPAVKTFNSAMDIVYNKAEHLVKITGKITSVVEQISVLSLDHFNQKYKIDFIRTFDTKMTLAQQRELEEFEDINIEIPDIVENGQIDIKAVSLEALALELDDFPKKKGEKFTFTPDFDLNNDKPQNPFAVLENLKK